MSHLLEMTVIDENDAASFLLFEDEVFPRVLDEGD